MSDPTEMLLCERVEAFTYVNDDAATRDLIMTWVNSKNEPTCEVELIEDSRFWPYADRPQPLFEPGAPRLRVDNTEATEFLWPAPGDVLVWRSGQIELWNADEFTRRVHPPSDRSAMTAPITPRTEAVIVAVDPWTGEPYDAATVEDGAPAAYQLRCPHCRSTNLATFSPCEGVHVLGDLEEADDGSFRVGAYWDTHTDMDGHSLGCRDCYATFDTPGNLGIDFA